MQYLGMFFGMIMEWCYGLMKNYGLALILFTLLTKVILMPISVMVQLNSIKVVKMYPELNRIKVKYFGNKEMISEEEYLLYKKENYHPMLDLVPVIAQLVILMGVVRGIQYIPEHDKLFMGLNLGVVPMDVKGFSVIIPILAAFSAWVMCYAQNKANVLQSEQSRTNQMTTLLLSVGISLYLGFFVEAGIGFYWTVSNLASVLVMYLLNFLINPKKYIDYEALAESKAELNKMTQYMKSNNKEVDQEVLVREKRDCKRFLKYQNKQIVFYSEKNGFYKYFQNVIEYILRKTDIVIHYITSDPNDEVFAKQSENFRVYYIGEKKLIILMMKLEADMMVMTMPDLQRYHIKRSMVKNDIEYIYMDHGIGSLNLMLRKHALDYFDTVFVSNELVYDEIRGQEKIYGLKEKNLVKYGYGLIDNMITGYEQQEPPVDNYKVILIAPSWQDDNIMDSCIEEILDYILNLGHKIILRPHPQYVRHFEERLNVLREKYVSFDNFELQLDFSSNATVFNADILMTDWSGIAYEYSFVTLKPTLFINTPMKIMNADYEEVDVVPFDLMIRNKVGRSLELNELGKLPETIDELLNNELFSKDSIKEIREKYLYNVGNSAKIGGDYIIKKLIEYSKR